MLCQCLMIPPSDPPCRIHFFSLVPLAYLIFARLSLLIVGTAWTMEGGPDGDEGGSLGGA